MDVSEVTPSTIRPGVLCSSRTVGGGEARARSDLKPDMSTTLPVRRSLVRAVSWYGPPSARDCVGDLLVDLHRRKLYYGALAGLSAQP